METQELSYIVDGMQISSTTLKTSWHSMFKLNIYIHKLSSFTPE